MARSTFRCNLAKYTGSRGVEAHAFRAGVDEAFRQTMTTADDCHWTALKLREDENGAVSWYVDLHSCPPHWPEAYTEGDD
jgi:hypothetical protein